MAHGVKDLLHKAEDSQDIPKRWMLPELHSKNLLMRIPHTLDKNNTRHRESKLERS